MPRNNIVGGEYGNPHEYGSTIWDMFMPNPSYKEELQQNIYATGFNEGSPSPGGVVEPRSPFGKLLQGIGLIGEPEARPLTDYEKMLVQLGAHHKSTLDYQTDKQRLDTLQESIGLVDDYIKEHGEMPPDDFMRGLGPEYNTAFRKALGEREEGVSYERAKREQDLAQGEQSMAHSAKSMEYMDWQMRQAKKQDTEARHYQKLLQLQRITVNERKRYELAQKEADEAMQLNDEMGVRRAFQKMRRAHAEIVAKVIQSGGDAADALAVAPVDNPDPDAIFGEPPLPEEDIRIFKGQGEGVQNYLRDQGYIGGMDLMGQSSSPYNTSNLSPRPR